MQNRLKELRESKHLRQADIANATGIDQRTLSNYETGKTNPDSFALVKLSDYYGVSIDYLLFHNAPNQKDSLKARRTIDRVIDELKEIREWI